MKLNRKLVLIVSLVLSLALATGGTLAYLQDTDADVNVMTLGNVHIEQHEYERVVNDEGEYTTGTFDGVTSYVLQEFTQGKPLLPIVGDPSVSGNSPAYAGWDTTTVRMTQVDSYGGMDVFAGKNAQDKFVTVENTGKSDAYIRTLVAVEIGSVDDTSLIMRSYHFTWTENLIGVITIDNNNYYLYEYTYNGYEARHAGGLLPAGDTSYPNLCQVYLKSKATNEDMEAIDGNGNGMLDILVVSQAVQAAGFESAEVALNTAFGDVTTDSHPWMDGKDGDQEPDMVEVTIVSSADELKAAISEKNAVIYVEDGIYDMGGTFSIAEGVTLAGMSERAVINGTLTNTLNNVTVKNVTFEGSNAIRWAYHKGDVTFENCTFNATGVYAIHFDGLDAGSLTFSNCDIIGWVAMAGNNACDILFENCTVSGNGTYGVIRVYSDATLKSCTFDVDNVNTTDDYQDGVHAVGCTITMIGCTNVNGTVEDLVNTSNDGVVNIQ